MLSLFSGIGGLDLAAEWAGMRVVAQCEIDPWCREVLKRHWPNVSRYEDVRRLPYDRLQQLGINLVCGGYPCQPFSFAGKGLAQKDPRHLWPFVRDVLAALSPSWFVGENVRGHVGRGLDDVLDDLEALGYTAWPHLVSAQGVGAPHRRERIVVVAHADRQRQQQQSADRRQERIGIANGGHAASDAVDARLQSRQQRARSDVKAVPDTCGTGLQIREQCDFWPRPRIKHERPAAAELSWWASEPAVGRVAHGVPRRVDRLKGLGNAVVPAQMFPFFEVIQRIEMTT